MVLHLFPLIAYLASLAFLVCWLIRLLIVAYQRVRGWSHLPRMWLPVKTWGKVAEENGIPIYFVGMLFGGLVTHCLMNIFVQEWLLVIYVVSTVLSDELQVSSSEMLLLEVMILFECLAAQTVNNQDLFEVLPNVIQELPEGRVRKCALEAVLRWRSGERFENNLKAMRRINPLLDEFVLTLQHSGWKKGPGMNIVLHRLIERAGQKWDRSSWFLLKKDKSRFYIQFSRSAFIAGMWVLIFNSLSNLDMIMVDRLVLGILILILLGLGTLFHLLFTNRWISRSMVISIFLIALLSYANLLTVPLPSWIRAEIVSHQSENLGSTDFTTPKILTVHEDITAPFQQSVTFNDPPLSAATHLISKPAPTSTLTPQCLTSNRANSMALDLCFLQSTKPR